MGRFKRMRGIDNNNNGGDDKNNPTLPELPDWNTTSQSSLVSIGTHFLFATVTGPPRHLGDPLVLIFAGAKETSAPYLPLSQLLSPTVRVFVYDRSGLGKSEACPLVQSKGRHTGPGAGGAEAAAELSALLGVLRLRGPYILVAHSYGGCVGREFLQARSREVVGMLLAETGTETVCRFHEEQYRRRILGQRPLCVIRGGDAFRIGVKPDGGTAEGTERSSAERTRVGMLKSMAEADETLKREQLKLSRRHRFRNVPGAGHSVHRSHPQVVAEEVKWVLQHLEPVHGSQRWFHFLKRQQSCH